MPERIMETDSRSPCASKRTRRHAATAWSVAMVAVLAASTVQAQTNFYWNGGNPSASPAGGGTGLWDTANAWRTGSDSGAQGTWAAGTGGTNVGFLAGTSGTVSLGSAGSTNFTGSSLTVETSGYTVTSPSGSRNLVMTGALTLGSNVAFTVDLNNAGGTWGFGSMTGGAGSSLTLSGAATANNANRVNLSGASATSDVPTITLSGGGAGPTGFVATATGHTLSSNIVNNSTTSATMLGATGVNSLNYSGVLSGSAHLQFSGGQSGGAGIVTLSNTNTFTGDTYTNSASNALLRIGIDNALPSTTTIRMGASAGGGTADNGGSIDLNGFNLTVASVTAASSARGIGNNTATLSTLTIGKASGTDTFGGAIGTVANTNMTSQSTNIALVKTGSSALQLSGSNDYTGGTTINGGELRIDAVAALPTTGAITVGNGGQLRLRVASGTFGGVAQTLTLNGDGPGGGTNDGALRSTEPGGVFQGPVVLASNSRIRANGANTITLTNAVSGAGGLEFIGGGTLTLGGANTYDGPTTISDGTLALGASGSLVSPLISVASGASFDVTAKTGFSLVTGQRLGGVGTILGDLEFGTGSQLAFNPSGALLIGSGTLSFASGFSPSNLFGLDSSTPEATYSLFSQTTGGSIDIAGLANFGSGSPFDLGSGKTAYFTGDSTSLSVVVVPEPSAFAIAGLGVALAGLGAWKRRRSGCAVQAG